MMDLPFTLTFLIPWRKIGGNYLLGSLLFNEYDNMTSIGC